MLVHKYECILAWALYNQEYKFSNFLLCIWSLSQLRIQSHALGFTCSVFESVPRPGVGGGNDKYWRNSTV